MVLLTFASFGDYRTGGNQHDLWEYYKQVRLINQNPRTDEQTVCLDISNIA